MKKNNRDLGATFAEVIFHGYYFLLKKSFSYNFGIKYAENLS